MSSRSSAGLSEASEISGNSAKPRCPNFCVCVCVQGAGIQSSQTFWAAWVRFWQGKLPCHQVACSLLRLRSSCVSAWSILPQAGTNGHKWPQSLPLIIPVPQIGPHSSGSLECLRYLRTRRLVFGGTVVLVLNLPPQSDPVWALDIQYARPAMRIFPVPKMTKTPSTSAQKTHCTNLQIWSAHWSEHGQITTSRWLHCVCFHEFLDGNNGWPWDQFAIHTSPWPCPPSQTLARRHLWRWSSSQSRPWPAEHWNTLIVNHGCTH